MMNKQKLLILILILLAVIYGVWRLQSGSSPAVTSYEECVKSKGSTLLTSYPATCVTEGGQSFSESVKETITPEETPEITQKELNTGWYYGSESQYKPGTPEQWVYEENGRSSCWHAPGSSCFIENDNTYVCPTVEWIDCMPGGAAKKECSTDYLTWANANCPDFKGAAY